jgi:hypothetical protein
MFSTILIPWIFVSFLMLRVVNFFARSSMPTWSILGEIRKSGIVFGLVRLISIEMNIKVNNFPPERRVKTLIFELRKKIATLYQQASRQYSVKRPPHPNHLFMFE